MFDLLLAWIKHVLLTFILEQISKIKKSFSPDKKYIQKEEMTRATKNKLNKSVDRISNYDNINFDSHSEFERLNTKVNRFEWFF